MNLKNLRRAELDDAARPGLKGDDGSDGGDDTGANMANMADMVEWSQFQEMMHSDDGFRLKVASLARRVMGIPTLRSAPAIEEREAVPATAAATTTVDGSGRRDKGEVGSAQEGGGGREGTVEVEVAAEAAVEAVSLDDPPTDTEPTALEAATSEATLRLERKEAKQRTLCNLEVKPWEEEQDLMELFAKIKSTVVKDGLQWGENCSLKPVAYGIKKICMTAVISQSVSMDEVT